MNRLANETSPYLLQHSHNPVDWYAWGDEALARARAENKPILLSIGYSACHWCHVMAHESFEDDATAAVMNDLFVNIKVDREERPDIDRIYQTAHQMMSQHGGGWPLTVFIAPDDQRPFFTGTYFPREPRHGMPAFKEVLTRVAEHYREQREHVKTLGAAVTAAFDELHPSGDGKASLTREPLEAARKHLEGQFDGRFGGFGRAPKFPHPAGIELLLRHWRASARGDEADLHALYMAALTLTRMAEGGIYDQLGGGFARYAVDDYWMIPHFEKMLYDNGQLLAVYAQAAVATGDELFRRVIAETSAWMLRDMRAPGGAFFSTLDADSEGHEGKFYVWTRDETRSLLTPDEYAVLASRFGLDRDANFEGAWHLHAYEPVKRLADVRNETEAATTTLIDSARAKLLDARSRRVWPGRDEKIITSWNGLAIAGLAAAARALERDDLAEAAAQAADFLHRECWKDGRLLSVYKDGRARFPAYLDDYASLAWGLLELIQARWSTGHLNWAIELTEVMLAHFADPSGGFFFTADDHEALIVRPRTFGDDATPSGNGMAARVLLRVGYLLGELRYLDAAEATLKAAWPVMAKYPQAHATLVMALDEFTSPAADVILRGDVAGMREWSHELDRAYDPKRFELAIPDDATGLPVGLSGKASGQGVTAYVCKGMGCWPPCTTVGELIEQLRSLR